MEVEFFRGVIQLSSGQRVRGVWCSAPFGIIALLEGGDGMVESAPREGVVSADYVTTVDLAGLDRPDVELVARAILLGGYLDRPNVKGKGDAVLFMLANEALRALDSSAFDSED